MCGGPVSTTLSSLLVAAHVTVAPRARTTQASYGFQAALPGVMAVLSDGAARDNVAVHLRDGRVRLSAPATSGGSFRRHFYGGVVEGPDSCRFHGEYVTDEFAAAFFFMAVICLLLIAVMFVVSGAIQVATGEPDAWGSLLFALGPLAMAVCFLAIYRLGAYAGLESQQVIHRTLLRAQREAAEGRRDA